MEKIQLLKNITVHCVGICSDADAELLDLIAVSSRRGTFQCIKDNDIFNLVSCLWGLMMEMVDDHVQLLVETVDANGLVRVIVDKGVILRACSVPLVVGFGLSAPTTTAVRARLVIGDRCLETSLDIPRASGFDTVCAEEQANLLMGELSTRIAVLLRAGNPSGAIVEITKTRQAIRNLLDQAENDAQRAAMAVVGEVVAKELDVNEADNVKTLADSDELRDAVLRAMSRSATSRNHGVTIIPDGRSLSSLQRQLSSSGAARL